MGIPKQVLEADEAMDKQLETIGQAPVETQAAAQPVQAVEGPKAQEPATPEPPKAVESTPKADASSDQTNKELQRMSSLFGRIRKSSQELDAKLEKLKEGSSHSESDAKIAALTAQVEKLAQIVAQNAAAKSQPVQSAAEAEPAVQSDATVSDAQIDSALKIFKAKGMDYTREEVASFLIANAVLKPQRRDDSAKRELEEMKAKLERFEAREQKFTDESFFARVKKSFPGLMEMDSRGDPEWTRFLDSPLPPPMSQFSYREIAMDALNRRDFEKFAEVATVFSQATGYQFLPEGANGPEGMITPGNVSVSQKPVTKAKPVYKRAEVEAFRKAVLTKTAAQRYGLSPQDIEKVSEAYDDAEAEGRIIE